MVLAVKFSTDVYQFAMSDLASEVERHVHAIVQATRALRALQPQAAMLREQVIAAMPDSADLDIIREVYEFGRVRYTRIAERIPPGTEDYNRAGLGLPLFSGHAHHDYERYKADLEPIFTSIFPNWHSQSYDLEIKPIANIPINTA
jgi:hypothetical protein